VDVSPKPPWSVNGNSDITAEAIRAVIEELGLKTQLRRTGHRDYQRVFVYRGGVTIGRACIYRGKISHMKWYGEKFFGGFFVKESVLLDARLEVGRVPTEEEFRAAAKRSKERALAKYEEKLRWREEHPHPQGKQRKRLEKPNVHATLYPELISEMRKNDGAMTDELVKLRESMGLEAL
jgi:hypothetical protein